MFLRTITLIALIAALTGRAAETVLVVEQDYNIVEMGKEGPTAKDIRQKLYIHKDMVCIDEYGGKDAGKPTESIVVDLKNKKIINLNHIDKKKVVEDFEARRRRIEKRKKDKQDDLDAQPAGPQRERVEKLYRALLDDKRRYAFDKSAGAAKTLAGVNCQPVKVIADDVPNYVPLEAYLHPDIELPYDNAEMLYLLQIIGEKMSEFMRRNKESFKKLPMELHLDLAAGGRLDTKVVSFEKVDKDRVTSNLRGALGSPFVIPENYDETRRVAAPPKTNDRPD
ncbi:MAG TPA: hypothetical protein VEK08_04125 [Planctomycetota bacterium]|nr:hypothetical protein [Planctomycetota bacterium]